MMWPPTLQMSRDECRGKLRTLELDSYSVVLSMFRAQGGLTENKCKLLEELRNICHISLERHRSEARRVANDEQLATIAEVMSGPNTWQEWSREGRRAFPLLPRVAPKTALSLLANSISAETASENSSLPYPSETGEAAAAEKALYAEMKRKAEAATAEGAQTSNAAAVVTSNPFKVPDIPPSVKKSLKRNQQQDFFMPHSAGGNRRRLPIDAMTHGRSNQTLQQNKLQKLQQQQQQSVAAGAIAATAAGAGTASNIKKLYNNHAKTPQSGLPAQPKSPKAAGGRKRNGANTTKRVTTGVRGKRAQANKERKQMELLQQQQQLEEQQQQQEQQLQEQQLQEQQIQVEQQEQQQQLALAEQYQHSLPQSVVAAQQQQQAQYEMVDMELEPPMETTMHSMPQIAVSKKDISKNLSKLHLPISPNNNPQHSLLPGRVQQVELIATSRAISSTSPPTFYSSSSMSSLISGSISAMRQDKSLISTPVQKYIVEDRSSSLVHQSGVQTFPQRLAVPTAANKLRAVNTSLLPPGAKLTSKKLTGNTMITTLTTTEGAAQQFGQQQQSQVFSIVDGNTTPTAAHPQTPMHTPPAVMQLSNSAVAEGSATAAVPAQSKVLNAKLMPVVLSGTGHSKLENLNNGATIVNMAANNSKATGAIGVFKTNNTIITQSGQNLIRNTPTTQIIKNSATTSKINESNLPPKPQILSNIKLPNAIIPSTATGSNISSAHFLKSPGSTIRANVNIRQAADGRCIIQPASAEAVRTPISKYQPSSNSFSQKLFSTPIRGVNAANTPQRITVKRINYVTTPQNNNVQLQNQYQQQATAAASNLMFLSNSPSANAPLGNEKAGNSGASGSTKNAQQNIYVIGTVPQQSQQQQQLQQQQQSANRAHETNQMITEDTPVDILNMNMPIVIAEDTGKMSIYGNKNRAEQSSEQSSPIVVDATDWEMELDQATARGRGGTSSVDEKSHIVVHDSSNYEDVIVEESYVDVGSVEDAHPHLAITAVESGAHAAEAVAAIDTSTMSQRQPGGMQYQVQRNKKRKLDDDFQILIEEKLPKSIKDMTEATQTFATMEEASVNEYMHESEQDDNLIEEDYNDPNTSAGSIIVIDSNSSLNREEEDELEEQEQEQDNVLETSIDSLIHSEPDEELLDTSVEEADVGSNSEDKNNVS